MSRPRAGPRRPPDPPGAAAVRWSSVARLVGLVVAAALLSFVWTPYDPTQVDPADPAARPVGATHWLGTDKFGRDVFSQIMVGARTTLFVGVVAVGVAAMVGIPLGILAAMAPRWLGELVMRTNDLRARVPRAAAGDHVRRGLRAEHARRR